ncbi:TetR family transcriptional regulator [Roseomonas sp. NAR14]|uniref:TetR family transcriptional regulator n=1 Tax=Roseomonas acroporae TaxID=2937791 RepID=A0A9X2BVL6_9PROT|nr:TetR family transcriptional regulator [Roseomonas acroporae]MCK8784124.1 TetR family transcriptional regulator [Roseomonas acroporae]
MLEPAEALNESAGAEETAAPTRSRAPEQTRRAILDAAIAEFAEKGLSGARVDEIAARTATTKRMIYYYFTSKEQLFAAVLEEMYGGIREAERGLVLDTLPPAEAMRRLVEVTFDYHAAHPEFVRLVAVENIHHASHIAQSPTIGQRNATVIGTVRTLLERGVREGVFRAGVDPFDLHMLINGFCFHRVSNRHTLGVIYGRDLTAPEQAAAQKRMIVEAVLGYLRPEAAAGAPAAPAP